jgi:hypothetical protein
MVGRKAKFASFWIVFLFPTVGLWGATTLPDDSTGTVAVQNEIRKVTPT